MISQKNKKITIIILSGIGIVSIISVAVVSDSSCGIKHIMILNDLKIYESTLDPEFCEDLLEKIDSFNLKCQPEVEILDCG